MKKQNDKLARKGGARTKQCPIQTLTTLTAISSRMEWPSLFGRVKFMADKLAAIKPEDAEGEENVKKKLYIERRLEVKKYDQMIFM